jgi:hypothetical protein
MDVRPTGVAIGPALVLQHAQAAMHLGIPGDDEPTLSCRDERVGAERERASIADRPERASADARSKRMRRILDHEEVMAMRQREQRIERSRPPAQVHGDDRTRAGCEHAFHRVGVEPERHGLDVGQDRRGAREPDRVRRRRERDVGHDDLVAGPQPKRGQREEERGGATRGGHHVGDVEQRRQPAFERERRGAVVDDAPLEHRQYAATLRGAEHRCPPADGPAHEAA